MRSRSSPQVDGAWDKYLFYNQMILLTGRRCKSAKRDGESMEDALKGSSCGTSMDGTTAMDVDGVTFLAKRLEDVDVMKTTSLWIIL